MNMIRVALLLVALSPCIAGADVKISNLEDLTVPVRHDGTPFSPEEVGAMIIEGCAARGWSATLESDGMISASILVRGKHLAQIAIPFSPTNYSLLYVSSDNLDYNPRKNTIHRNYNKWVLKLSRTIGQMFSRGIQNSQESVFDTTSADDGDVYTKLLQLGELREKGIISEEEFQAEKSRLLERE